MYCCFHSILKSNNIDQPGAFWRCIPMRHWLRNQTHSTALRSLLICTGILASLCADAQDFTTLRSKLVPWNVDSLQLDTQLVLPGSVRALPYPFQADITLEFRFEDNTLYPEPASGIDSALVQYRILAIDPVMTYSHKDSTMIRAEGSPFDPYIISPTPSGQLPSQDRLVRSGSLSRGITVGNNQDLSVNSSLNLQLSGYVTDDVQVLASITDDNLPIQPDGNTQQLQDFDQVFVKLFTDDASLTAGDFQIRQNDGHFLKYQKRARGALAGTLLEKDSIHWNRIEASAALSKGKFARNEIQGVEGNQGPYRLRGAENETFIVVLAGTERVYIDGRLLERGRDYDYILDYNAAELTFMPRQPITKDRRIVVEFQYSDKNYARSLLTVGATGRSGSWSWNVQGFAEQDSKNQPLQQELSEAERQVMALAGDETLSAVILSIDSTGYLPSEVRYSLVDSLGYDSVLVASTAPDEAVYRASFSFVGSNNGDYVEDDFSANGRVFRWVAPDTVAGQIIPQGDYLPLRVLVTPKKQQMAQGELRYTWGNGSYLQTGLAVSNEDLNTFSNLDAGDNSGVGVFTEAGHRTKLAGAGDSALFATVNFSHEYVSSNFSRVERFRDVEFSRNWNTSGLQLQSDQHLVRAGVELHKQKRLTWGVDGGTFQSGSAFSGYRAATDFRFTPKKTLVNYAASYTQTDQQFRSGFYRHKSNAERTLGKIVIGYLDEFENNERFDNDSLLTGSYQFHEWQAYTGAAEDQKNTWRVFYGGRTDWQAREQELAQIALATQYGASYGWLSNPNQQLQVRASRRVLEVATDSLISLKPEETLLGRLEHRARIAKGAIVSNLFYEIGSGLEQVREFVYLEVPAGQGVYVWVDYNEDGVRDLQEFEVAQFAYEANYIRTWIPSDEYARTYTNQFSETLSLQPQQVWNGKKGLKGFLARWQNTSAYRVERKTTREENIARFNPFALEVADTNLLSLGSSFRNNLSFDRSNPNFSADLIWQDQRNKNLLSSGVEARTDAFRELRLRFGLGNGWTGFMAGKEGDKRADSDFVSGRNYLIAYQSVEPSVQFQPDPIKRITAKFRWSSKQNDEDLGGETAEVMDFGLTARLSDPGKGMVEAEFHWVEIDYNGEANSSLGFEMLEGLSKGRNLTWSANIQRSLGKNLQLNVLYNGRKTTVGKTIHAGGMQVRAYF